MRKTPPTLPRFDKLRTGLSGEGVGFPPDKGGVGFPPDKGGLRGVGFWFGLK